MGVTLSTNPNGIETDGSLGSGSTPDGNATYSSPTVRNVTLIGNNDNGGGTAYALRFREDLKGSFKNILVYNFSTGNLLCSANGGMLSGENWTLGWTTWRVNQ